MPDRFDEFYSIYPRKKEPKEARKAYLKAVKGGALEHDIIEGARRYRQSCVGEEPKFIKYPATWLNRGCWDDEPDEVIKPDPQIVLRHRALHINSKIYQFGRYTDWEVKECVDAGLVTLERAQEVGL